MTLEAEIAKDVLYKFECKKDGFNQLQSGTSKVSLTIHPEDLDMNLVKDPMGQRYMCVLVPLDDHDQPQAKPKSKAGNAKMAAKDPVFQQFIASLLGRKHIDEIGAEDYIESYCNIKSCSEIIEGSKAEYHFKTLMAKYSEWQSMNALTGGTTGRPAPKQAVSSASNGGAA